MPIDYRLVADLEEGLDDEHLSDIRFGRSRFLRNAGLALFGLAAGVFAAPPQESNACWRSRYNGRCVRCCDWVNAFGRPCICRGYC
jgi:hypothetical protein